MPYYRVRSSEKVCYEHDIDADSEEEARMEVENFDGDWSPHIYDGDYFEIDNVREIAKEDLNSRYPLIVQKRESKNLETLIQCLISVQDNLTDLAISYEDVRDDYVKEELHKAVEERARLVSEILTRFGNPTSDKEKK